MKIMDYEKENVYLFSSINTLISRKACNKKMSRDEESNSKDPFYCDNHMCL